MFEKIGRVGMAIAACFVMWLTVAMVEMITGAGWMRDLAVLTAFVFTATIWLVLALPIHDQEAQSVSQEKTKRSAEESGHSDPRLALLLDLMSADERQAVKARLLDDLDTDGEIALVDLIAAQDHDSPAYRDGA